MEESFVGGVEKDALVGGVGGINTMQEDSLVQPTLPPTRAWISGRDPMLVVSIVTARKNPLFSFVCYFICVHHHALSPLHVLSNKIILLKPILFCLYGYMKQTLLFFYYFELRLN
jgi:hypothetical protein